jgi:hypothetical protein
VKEFELYIPLFLNDGTPVGDTFVDRIGQQLLEQFGGVTFLPQPHEGMWRMGNVTFRDKIVILKVLTSEVRVARRYFRQLKEKLKRELQQEEILIVVKDAERI